MTLNKTLLDKIINILPDELILKYLDWVNNIYEIPSRYNSLRQKGISFKQIEVLYFDDIHDHLIRRVSEKINATYFPNLSDLDVFDTTIKAVAIKALTIRTEDTIDEEIDEITDLLNETINKQEEIKLRKKLDVLENELEHFSDRLYVSDDDILAKLTQKSKGFGFMRVSNKKRSKK